MGIVLCSVILFLTQRVDSQQPPVHPRGGRLEKPSRERVLKFKVAAERALGKEVFAFQNGTTVSDKVFSWKDFIPFTSAEDQGSQCGSCYIFAGIGALEENWAIQHHGHSLLASQQLVLNCMGTCKGGYISSVLEFLINKGTKSAVDEPYTGIPSKCMFAPPLPYTGKAAEYIADDGRVPTESDLKAAILKYGPIPAFIYAGGTFDDWYGKDESVVITDDSKRGF